MDNNQSVKTSNTATKSLIIIIVIVLLAIGTYFFVPKESSKQESPKPGTTNDSVATSPSSPVDTSTYRDGSYKATGSYSTPGGQESIDVALTLKGGKITEVEATGSARGGTSEEYQSEFLSSYKQSVVGKPIGAVSLSRVAGSSLTSNGFNEALDEIKNDARG